MIASAYEMQAFFFGGATSAFLIVGYFFIDDDYFSTPLVVTLGPLASVFYSDFNISDMLGTCVPLFRASQTALFILPNAVIG